ncbi:phage shock protein C [Psychromonas ingrahamii 37]|uniref:Phage shock protein C n=1 Tax=Psychromonas ingrahamii (strain DSM 17664 / CCUG 51855 / 37) TaxID=357804 RepID=A1SV98_PSYIN|nr:envelope stress response membrane protein PspC [Psychromonas ingrahamii]ABM03413.1 phage shock protein C [Psychromonas ingrahamii 37]
MNKKRLHRDPKNAKLGGVCAGIAEYFEIEVWFVRLLVVSAFLFTAGFIVFLIYIVAYFTLDEMPEKQQWQQNAYKKHKVKKKAWQTGDSAQQILEDISIELDKMQKNIEQMEDYVTSLEYKINREFKNKNKNNKTK